MDPHKFSTELLCPRDQEDAWSEWFQPVFDVYPEDTEQSGFCAEYLGWQLGDVTVTRVSAPAARTVRTSRQLRRSPIDHWVITYCRHGNTLVSTKSGELNARARVPFVWSLGQPSDSRRTVADRLQLYLPRDSFSAIGVSLDMAVGSMLDTPIGHLLGDYMLALERRLPLLTSADGPALTNAVRAMVAAAVAPSPARAAVAKDQIEFGRMERVRKAVRRHLRSPVLDPATLCRLVGVSRSNLYRLLESVGGVVHYIQSQRLLEAHTILSEGQSDIKISALADDFCFQDVSSFSRAFRKEFGYSPSEARAAALTGCTLAAKPTDRGARDIAGFGDLLRGV